MDWGALYADATGSMPGLAREMKPVLAGLTACVDLSVRLDAAGIETLRKLESDPAGPAKNFGTSVLAAAAAGVGGELAFNWERGPAWIEKSFPTTEDLGGTGARVAQTLAALGGSAALCLADRSPRMLRLVHPDVLLSSPAGFFRAGDMPASAATDNVHYIFEFSRGTRTGGIAVPRSDRLIVRFGDLALESDLDTDFARLSRELTESWGAGVLSGFNELPPERLADGLESSRRLASDWRAAGMGMVHLELAGYRSEREMRQVTAHLSRTCDSLGMNAGELEGLIPGYSPVPSKLARAADAYNLPRVCVHGDRWAASLTTGPPEKEMLALLTGSAVASSIAREGNADVRSHRVDLRGSNPPQGVTFGIQKHGDRWMVACPVPYVAQPKVTVGLGDAFLAGTLLVLGNGNPRNTPTPSTKPEFFSWIEANP